jgi:phosphopantetheinyl transferase
MAEKTVVLVVTDTGSDLAKALIARWMEPEERSAAALLRRKQARANSLLGRAVLRALLYRHTGYRDWTVAADHRGKIAAVGSMAGGGPAISLSHSRGVVACALADAEALGVDIEWHRPRAWSALAAYAFGKRERALVAEGGAQAFYRIWTLREAWAKATGEGLVAAADGRDQVDDGPLFGLWSKASDGRVWLFGHHHARRDLSLSVAALLTPDAKPAEWSLTWLDAAALPAPP